jgi:Zn-dependent oligopeptidase
MRGKIILFVLFFSSLVFAQNANQQLTELQQAKIVLADMTMHANQLEKQNIQLNQTLQSLVNDLKAIKEPGQELKAVMEKYGIGQNGVNDNR